MKNTWTIIGIVVIVVLVLLLLGSVGMMGLGGFGARGMMSGGYGGLGMMGGFRPLSWLVSCIFGLFILGGIVALIAWFARNAGKTASTSAMPLTSTSQSPLDILKERYAKGEITKEQFDAMKQDLS